MLLIENKKYQKLIYFNSAALPVLQLLHTRTISSFGAKTTSKLIQHYLLSHTALYSTVVYIMYKAVHHSLVSYSQGIPREFPDIPRIPPFFRELSSFCSFLGLRNLYKTQNY